MADSTALGIVVARLRESIAALRSAAHAKEQVRLVSPRIWMSIRRSSRRSTVAEESPSALHHGPHVFAYCVRPRIVAEIPPDRASFRPVPAAAIRFDVTDADEGFLDWLGRNAPGFHVLEAPCAGFERWWRSDLAMVHETRAGVVGEMTVVVGSGRHDLQHVAVPIFERNRIVAIRGWLDRLDWPDNVAIPAVDWGMVRCVRRFERARPLALPPRLLSRLTVS